jgi:hypothetical protein
MPMHQVSVAVFFFLGLALLSKTVLFNPSLRSGNKKSLQKFHQNKTSIKINRNLPCFFLVLANSSSLSPCSKILHHQPKNFQPFHFHHLTLSS